MKRKQITFFASYYESLRELPDAERVALYDGIMMLAFEGKEPRFESPTLRAAWTFIRPMLQHSINKSNAGMVGGAPKGNQNARKTPKSESVDFEEINHQKNKQKTNIKQTQNKQKTSKKQAENKQETNTKQAPDAKNSNIIINNNNTIKGEKPAAPAAENSENKGKPILKEGDRDIYFNIYNNNNLKNIIPEIIKIYNTICAREKKLPTLLAISEKRRAKLRLRWQEWAKMQGVGATPLDVFTAICEKMVATPFCTGTNNRGWRASFDFIIDNDSNYMKILEGRYDNPESKQTTNDYGSRHLNERAAENEYWRQQHDIARAIAAGGGDSSAIPDDGGI